MPSLSEIFDFLDCTRTVFVEAFNFDPEKYPQTTDPLLNERAVLVFAIKDKPKGKVHYSFLDITEFFDEECEIIIQEDNDA